MHYSNHRWFQSRGSRNNAQKTKPIKNRMIERRCEKQLKRMQLVCHVLDAIRRDFEVFPLKGMNCAQSMSLVYLSIYRKKDWVFITNNRLYNKKWR